MYRIIDSASSGKTKKLLHYAHDHGATIVCAQPHAIQEKAKAYGLGYVSAISYDDFLYPSGEIDPKETYCIDEVELLLNNINQNIVGYNLTCEEI